MVGHGLISLATARRKPKVCHVLRDSSVAIKPRNKIKGFQHLSGRFIISDFATRQSSGNSDTDSTFTIPSQSYHNSLGRHSLANTARKINSGHTNQDRLMNKSCEELMEYIMPFRETPAEKSKVNQKTCGRRITKSSKFSGFELFDENRRHEESPISYEDCDFSRDAYSSKFDEDLSSESSFPFMEVNFNRNTFSSENFVHDLSQMANEVSSARAAPAILAGIRQNAEEEGDWTVVERRTTSFVASDGTHCGGDHLSFIEQMERRLTATNSSNRPTTSSWFPLFS